MKQKWGKREDNEWGWWACWLMLAVMVVMFILKVR